MTPSSDRLRLASSLPPPPSLVDLGVGEVTGSVLGV